MPPPLTCECGTCQKCKRRAYMRKWYRQPGNAERQREKQRRYNATHPEAGGSVRSSIERRRVRKAAQLAHPIAPEACELCGDPEARLHRHHDDYSRPLDIRWLCPRCHGIQHRKVA